PKHSQTDFTSPSFLPDGKHFLYSSFGPQKELSGIYLGSLDGATNERLIADYSNAAYATASDGKGYVLFGREETLMAQAFDTERLKLDGEPFLVSEHVATALGNILSFRQRNFSVSENGVLVFDALPGRRRNQLIWADRAGNRISSLVDLENVSTFSIAPDNK